MRRIIVLILSISLGFFGYSQEAPEMENKENNGIEEMYAGDHELKLNTVYLLGGIFDMSYEYILNNKSAIGLSVAVPVKSDIDLQYLIIPYYRLFFGDKRAAGFFIEGNGGVFSGEYETLQLEISSSNDIHFVRNLKTTVGAGLGLAIGGKFMNKSGWIGEIFGGGGKNFLNNDKIDDFYPRFGIKIGKRF